MQPARRQGCRLQGCQLLAPDGLGEREGDDERAHDRDDHRDEELQHAAGPDADDADDTARALRDGEHLHHGGVGRADAATDEGRVEREAQLEAVTEDLYQENLTFSPGDKARERWIARAMSGRSENLLRLSRKLYGGLQLPRHENALVLNASHGLLLWPLMKMNPEGLSVAAVRSDGQKEMRV